MRTSWVEGRICEEKVNERGALLVGDDDPELVDDVALVQAREERLTKPVCMTRGWSVVRYSAILARPWLMIVSATPPRQRAHPMFLSPSSAARSWDPEVVAVMALHDARRAPR